MKQVPIKTRIGVILLEVINPTTITVWFEVGMVSVKGVEVKGVVHLRGSALTSWTMDTGVRGLARTDRKGFAGPLSPSQENVVTQVVISEVNEWVKKHPSNFRGAAVTTLRDEIIKKREVIADHLNKVAELESEVASLTREIVRLETT